MDCNGTNDPFHVGRAYKPTRAGKITAAAHVVWGASLGIAEEHVNTAGKEMLEGERGAPGAE